MVLGYHLIAIQRLQAVVGFYVLNVWVVAITPEEVEVALFRIILNHEVTLGLQQVCLCNHWLLIANLPNLLNYSYEKTRSILVVRHYSNTFVQLI